MSHSVHPQLSHCGIYARDVGTLVDFYTRVLGLVVADRGVSPRLERELAFLTASPEQHHQLVLMSGRGPGDSTVNQLSFKVPDINALKAMYRRAREAGSTDFRPVSHGNALSFYFQDPEGNGVEIYMDTPWYVPQPHGVPVDLTKPNDAILAETERHCRETPGFMPLEAWQEEVLRRLERA